MAQDRSRYGQPSPPLSEGHEWSVAEYGYHNQPSALPYTPPQHSQHERPADINDFDLVLRADRSQTYGDPEECEMVYQQPTFYRTGHGCRTPPVPIISRRMQTRSGRAINSPARSTVSPFSRSSESSRAKKKKRSTKAATNDPHVTEPLSEMTKDYEIPMQDMMAWVKRVDGERHAEANKKGKTPRPLNSFMCYRAAFKNRIRAWGKQGDNNQLISRVAGLSWAIESEEVKDFYRECARIEAESHAKAFPNYKFAPNKSIKKRAREDDDESDPDWNGSEYGGRPKRANRREIPRSMTSTPMEFENSTYHPSLHATNPHLVPMQTHMYDQWSGPRQHPVSYSGPQVQYVTHRYPVQYAPTSMPMQPQQLNYHPHFVSMPSHMTETELSMPFGMVQEQIIDPGLGDFNDPAFPEDDQGYGVPPEDGLMYAEVPEMVLHPGEQTLTINDPTWPSHGQIANAFDHELDQWDAGD